MNDDDRLNHEWDALTSALNDLGVLHVAPSHERRPGASIVSMELFRQLLESADARLQQAAIVLLLTQPELADDARAAIRTLKGRTLDRAMRRYVAACAMQRMARTRIAMQLGAQPDLPPDFLDELELPPLDLEYGKLTLWELAQQEEVRYGYDAWGTYWALLNHFLAESRRPGWRKACVSAPTAPA